MYINMCMMNSFVTDVRSKSSRVARKSVDTSASLKHKLDFCDHQSRKECVAHVLSRIHYVLPHVYVG